MARPQLPPELAVLCGQCARVLLAWAFGAALLLASGLATT